MWGRGVYVGISHASHLKRAEFQSSSVLGVHLYLCPHPLICLSSLPNTRGVDPGVVGSWPPENMYERSEYVWPLKMSILSFKTVVVYNSASFTSSSMKDLCQKWKVKLIFQGAYRLPRTWIFGCLEIIDVWYNLKQFDGLAWLTPTPRFHNISTPLTNTKLLTETKSQDVNGGEWQRNYVESLRFQAAGNTGTLSTSWAQFRRKLDENLCG